MGLLQFLSRKPAPPTGIGSRNSVGVNGQAPRGSHSISTLLSGRADEVHARRQTVIANNTSVEPTTAQWDDGSSTASAPSVPLSPTVASLHKTETVTSRKPPAKPPKKPRLLRPKTGGGPKGAAGTTASSQDSRTGHGSLDQEQGYSPGHKPGSWSLSSPHPRHDSIPPQRGFIDILDAQSELRPSDFRSRVRAAGARDYGEDVAERNLGENGTDLSLPSVQQFYSKTDPTRHQSDATTVGGDSTLPHYDGAGGGFGSRRSRSLANIALNSVVESPPAPDLPLRNELRLRRQSAGTPAVMTPPKKNLFRMKRAQTPSMIRTDIDPFLAQTKLDFRPPVIPRHTPPVSPRSLRDSVVLAKEKQLSSPRSGRPHPRKRLMAPFGSELSYNDKGGDDQPCAPPPQVKRDSRLMASMTAHGGQSPFALEHRGRALTRKWAAGLDSPYSAPIPSPACTLPHEYESMTSAASFHRHWSFSSTAPSTCISTPHSMNRPISRNTANTVGTWIDDCDDDCDDDDDDDGDCTAAPSRRASASSSDDSKLESCPPSLDCSAVEARVIIPNPGPAAPRTDVAPSSDARDFAMDEYISSNDSAYLSDSRGGRNTDGADTSNLEPRRRPGRREEDADFLFRSSGYGGDGSKQLPGLFDSMQGTGIATAMPLQSHPTPKLKPPVRPSSLATYLVMNGLQSAAKNRVRETVNLNAMAGAPFRPVGLGAGPEDGEDQAECPTVQRAPAASGASRRLSAPLGSLKLSGESQNADMRRAIRLHKRAKTLSRLTGTAPPGACPTEADAESDDAGDDEREDEEQ